MSQLSILIIRLSSIGDILLTTPFIRQVQHHFKDARIEFVCKKKYSDLMLYNPYVDHVHVFEKNIKSLTKKLQTRKYDYIFDLHNNFRSIYIRSNLKAKYQKHIRKDKLKQLLLLYLHINRYKKPVHIANRYLQVAEPFGVTDNGEGLELYWPEQITKKTLQLLSDLGISAGHEYISIAPGAGFFTKRWPVNYFQELVNQINNNYNFKFLILGGSEDNELGDYLSDSETVINLCGQTTLLESAVILSKSKALITNDTGLMHMATAVNTPLVAIFGSSVQEWGFAPYRSTHVLIENTNLLCRPCSHIGQHECPQRHFKCMKDILPSTVYDSFSTLVRE